MARTSTVPLAHPESFFIGGSWVAPSSDSSIDVIDAGTEELASRSPRRRPPTWPARSRPPAPRSTRPVAPADPRRARRLPPCPRRGADGAQRRAGRAVAARVGRARQHRAVLGDDGGQRARDLRRARRHLRVRGAGAAVGPRLRPAGARAGRCGRRDHPVERAGAADHAQDRPRAARRLHGRAQDRRRKRRARATCSPRPRRRSASRPACSTW